MTETNPFAALQQIAGGYALARCLHVVADLGVADVLDGAPRTAADLASDVGAHADALGRVLRLLAAHGVFAVQGEAFGHSAASRLLRSDHPQSMRAFARMFGLPVNWATYGALGHSLRTGRPASEQVIPEGYWAYFGQQPEANAIFNAAMAGKAQGQIGAILAAYDFSPFRRIADIGGGRGHLLGRILETVPQAEGVLFDLPHVIAESTGTNAERLTFQAGDFFKDALPSSDAYLLMDVIHDWSDEDSVAILKAVRRAAGPTSRVLLLETIIPDTSGPDWSKTLDVHMLTLLGGRQRTCHQFAALLAAADLKLIREIPTRSDISILEAAPAGGSA